MKQTEIYKNSPEVLAESSKLKEASQLVGSFESTTDFIRATSGMDTYSSEYAEALSTHTEAFIDQQGDIVDNELSNMLRVIANAGYMSHASAEVNQYQDRRRSGERIPDDEWKWMNSLKEQLVWYNHQLRDYIYDHPEGSMSELRQLTVQSALNTNRDSRGVSQFLNGVLRGARTEAVVGQLLDRRNVPYQLASIAEDLRGADIFIKGHKVDLKSSLDQLAGSSGNYDFTSEGKMYVIDRGRTDDNILLFPGFTETMLLDSLSLDDETADEVSMQLAIQLHHAIAEIETTD